MDTKRTVLLFVLLSFVLSAPFLVRLWHIHELYTDSEARTAVYASAQYLQQQGILLSTVHLTDVQRSSNGVVSTFAFRYPLHTACESTPLTVTYKNSSIDAVLPIYEENHPIC